MAAAREEHRQESDKMRDNVAQSIAELRIEMNQRIDQLRAEFNQAIAELRPEMTHAIDQLRADNNRNFRWLIGLVFANLVINAGIMARLAKLI